ncbi:MAG: 2,3-bisphosphoglycerate-independent phosphoglycerate mutase [Proteobacteria bacterium]|nr:2,3-bisphosphoglycerate-independent phosphoglycerate mutase [Pseudomonadota bacterium]
MKLKHRPFVLIILDGWGYREQSDYNAIAAAHTPNWDTWWANCPHTVLTGSGECVGLPEGQMGNSEVGHMHIGAGRIIDQDLTRINKAINHHEFCQNPVLSKTIETTIAKGGNLHVLGLLSPGGVHSHEDHIQALIDCAAAQGLKNIFVHAFLDGRDTPPSSAETSLKNLDTQLKKLKCGSIVSIVGRYYAMDRDNRWDRIQKAYELITNGKAEFHAMDALSALKAAYERGETDEFVQPTSIYKTHPITIEENDCVIFMNFRADRARQLTRAFVETHFDHFSRQKIIPLKNFVTLTSYDKNFPVEVIFPPISMSNSLGEYIAHLRLKQLRIAETEKYAHVTFFMNGGREKPFTGEDRTMIPSPKIATYDEQPSMSAPEVTQHLITAIRSRRYDLIICNYANADMVGHTGNFNATVAAIECLDRCLGEVMTALQSVGGEAMITADHGNAEFMHDDITGQPHTAHTTEPVPLLYIGRPAKVLQDLGVLTDIAPTLIHLMGLPVPKEMTGHCLFETT